MVHDITICCNIKFHDDDDDDDDDGNGTMECTISIRSVAWHC